MNEYYAITIISNKKPISIISVGNVHIYVDKKFNWFQKKMIKWCFGFEVKENIDNEQY